MAIAKHKLQKLIFELWKQELVDFVDELQRLAKGAIGDSAQSTIEQFIYAKMLPQLKKTINQRIPKVEHVVKHIERGRS